MRAVSLLLVFLFHLDVSFLKFGYLGVDIFFIISGFLMSIILHKYNAFTYIKARFTRLYPALSFVTCTSLIIGYFILVPGEYLSLGKSVLSALSFSSNYFYLFNTGYFDLDAKLQFLLHTWSLGNEFLCYLIVFFIWLLLGRNSLNRTSVLIVALSVIYILFTNDIQYLDPIPRIFLFFLSFCVSSKFYGKRFNDKLLILLSIISTVVLVVFWGSDLVEHVWPSSGIFIIPFVVIPILLMSSNIIKIKPINTVFVKVGDWSYSIYLWHWLVISSEFVFLRNTTVYSVKEAVILFVPSFILGVFSYYFIERNTRLSVVTTLISVVFSLFVIFNKGIESRVEPVVLPYVNIQKMAGVDIESSYDVNGIIVKVVKTGTSGKSIFIVGDSLSNHIQPMIMSSDKYNNYTIYSINYTDVVDFVDNFEIIESEILKKKSDLFISFLWGHEVNSEVIRLKEKILTGRGYDITILREAPSYEKDLSSCFIKDNSSLLFIGCDFIVKDGLPQDKIDHKNIKNWNALNEDGLGYEILDVQDKMCADKLCLMFVNGEFIMRDKVHFNEKLSNETNKIIGNMIFN